jgi:hypothetical protein
MSTGTDRIRLLNDELRQHLYSGGAVMTPGIAALGDAAVNRIVNAIASFHDFSADNDPWGEHDFGTLQFEGHFVVFKIDYYALDGESHSPDPSDPGVTERVITIMLAEEY